MINLEPIPKKIQERLKEKMDILGRNKIVSPNISTSKKVEDGFSEAAKLLNITTKEVQRDRMQAAIDLQTKYGGIIILKGSGTIIRFPNKTYVCLHGNSGMGTAGMGDCLSGIILSIIGMSSIKSFSDAKLFATGLHSFAADLIFKEKGGT